jgi:hypothetical protein
MHGYVGMHGSTVRFKRPTQPAPSSVQLYVSNCKPLLPHSRKAGYTHRSMRITAHLAEPALYSAIAATVVVSTMAIAHRRRSLPAISMQPTSFNKGALSRCPSLTSVYNKFIVPGGHVETIFAAWFRRNPPVEYDRELMETPDGGTVALDYHHAPPNKVSYSSDNDAQSTSQWQAGYCAEAACCWFRGTCLWQGS